MTLAIKEPLTTAAEPIEAQRHAFFGSVALGLVNAGRMALQMAVLPILARLLGPEAVGLVSLAMPFILLATQLSDAGLGVALVRRTQPTAAVESTVFWCSVGLGVVAAACVCAAAPLAARGLHQPALKGILIALAPILVLSSSLSVANSRISRSRRFALFAVGDLISLVGSSAVAILAARAGFGFWSLVAQQLVLWVAKAAWVLPASRFRPSLVFKPRDLGDLLSFGLNNVGANIADFFGKSAPALIIGGQLGAVALGRYAIAYQLVRAPDLVLSGPLFLATFTAIAALVAHHREPTQLSLRALRLTITALAPLFVGLALTSDLIVDLFLGEKWRGAGPVLAALSPAGFFLCAYTMAGAVLMGLGRSDLQFRLSLACGLMILTGAAVGARFGVEAAAAGSALGAMMVSPAYVVTLGRQLRADGRAWAASFGWPMAATVVMALAVLATRHAVAGWPQAPRLAACVLGGAAVFAAVLGITCRGQLLDDVRRILPGKPILAVEPS